MTTPIDWTTPEAIREALARSKDAAFLATSCSSCKRTANVPGTVQWPGGPANAIAWTCSACGSANPETRDAACPPHRFPDMGPWAYYIGRSRSDRPVCYPLVGTDRDETQTVCSNRRLALVVQWAADQLPIRCCGESWCDGGCGMPALVIPAVEDKHRELKGYSDVVACGALMQAFRVKWTGGKVEVPPEHRDDFLKRMWW